jgi:hypothetical protein
VRVGVRAPTVRPTTCMEVAAGCADAHEGRVCCSADRGPACIAVAADDYCQSGGQADQPVSPSLVASTAVRVRMLSEAMAVADAGIAGSVLANRRTLAVVVYSHRVLIRHGLA